MDWRDRFYDEECSPTYECQACGWRGYESEMVGTGEYMSADPEAPELVGCPACGSRNLLED